MNEGKMIYPAGKNYFIFYESNYTTLDINGTKMNALYLKQKYLYDRYKISNYIFVFDHQNENLESISDATSNLAKSLNSEFKIDSNNAMIGFF